MDGQGTLEKTWKVRKKYLVNEFVTESGNSVDGQGTLEKTWKVREKYLVNEFVSESGNLWMAREV